MVKNVIKCTIRIKWNANFTFRPRIFFFKLWTPRFGAMSAKLNRGGHCSLALSAALVKPPNCDSVKTELKVAHAVVQGIISILRSVQLWTEIAILAYFNNNNNLKYIFRNKMLKANSAASNGYTMLDQHLMAYCRAFSSVRQGTILNTIESSALPPIPEQW